MSGKVSSPSASYAEDEQALDSSRWELRFGLVIAGAFFVGLLGWAALTPLDAGAMAPGVVAVSGNRQAVQHRDGGTVTELNVVDGQTVRQGDVLLRISASEIVALERGLTGEVTARLAEGARLVAERDHLPDIVAPAEFAAYSTEDVAAAEAALRGQRVLLQARRRLVETEREMLNEQIRQHSSQIAGFTHQMRSNREQQRLMGQELDSLRSLLDRGFVAINRLRAIERSAAELDGNYGALQADIARASSAIAESRLKIVSLDRTNMEEVATQLRDVQMRLDDLQPRLASARDQLARSTVRAPAGGRVVGLKVFTVGGVVAPGDVLMEVVPQDRALIIEARASPTDADDLKVGMATQVRFSALQERNLPILHGSVSTVSADSIEDSRTGQRYFKVEVVVPPSEIDRIREIRGDSGLRAGLPAEVMIPLRKRSAFAYLLEPLTQTLWSAGREN